MLDFIGDLFPASIASLFRLVLTTTYFQWNGGYYEQTDGVAKGSPLSPVVANFNLEKFEELAVTSATLNPKCWFRYVVTYSFCKAKGKTNLHVPGASQRCSPSHTVHDEEGHERLAGVSGRVGPRKADGSVGQKVCCKPKHIDRYL